MNRTIKRIVTFAAFIPLALLLSGCTGISSEMQSFLKIFTWISFGMAVLGGLVAIFSDNNDTRGSSAMVGFMAVIVGVLLVIILVA